MYYKLHICVVGVRLNGAKLYFLFQNSIFSRFASSSVELVNNMVDILLLNQAFYSDAQFTGNKR